MFVGVTSSIVCGSMLVLLGFRGWAIIICGLSGCLTYLYRVSWCWCVIVFSLLHVKVGDIPGFGLILTGISAYVVVFGEVR